MRPPSAGVWEFRLRVAPTARARSGVSPVRTVVARGQAASTLLVGFVSTPAAVLLGTTVIDEVRVVPRASRRVEVWTRPPDSTTFGLTAVGRTTTAGVYKVTFRPTTKGIWLYRLFIRASTTARAATSPTRAITATEPLPPPAPVTPPSTPPAPVTPPSTPPPVTSTPVAVLQVDWESTSPVKVTVDDSIWFDAGGSSPSRGRKLVSGSLAFGDGTPPVALPYYDSDEDYYVWETSHTYATTGAKTATLTVTDSAGLTASTSVTVLVYEAPTFRLADTQADEDVEVAFDLEPWTPSGTSFTYYWVSYGDGTYEDGTSLPDRLTHTYAEPGNYEISVDAGNDAGSYVSELATVRVAGAATRAVLRVSADYGDSAEAVRVTVPMDLQLDASQSYAMSGRTLDHATLSFDDGTPSVSFFGQPLYWTVSHRLTTTGRHTPTLTVWDSSNVSVTSTVTVDSFLPPSVTITAAANPVPAKTDVSFDIVAITPDGTAWTGYDIWGVGDEAFQPGTPPKVLTLVFPTPGNYTVRIDVHNDTVGGSAWAEVPVTVI